MKIIGGHDFYDGAGWGVDETCVFLRQKHTHFDQLDEIEDHPFEHLGSIVFGRDDYVLRPFFVVIAGEIFPGVEHEVKGTSYPTYTPPISTFTYDAEEALEIFDDYVARGIGYTFPNGFMRSQKEKRQMLVDHFAERMTRARTDWILDNRVTILTTKRKPYSRPAQIVAHTDHALLKELAFFRCMNPATLHMRIANFISGVLPSSKETVNLSDKDKIRKAGFDTVTSFRKAPQK